MPASRPTYSVTWVSGLVEHSHTRPARSRPRLTTPDCILDNHLYRRFGEFVCDLFALGFHRQRSVESGVPFYLSETRKRIFAAACRRDKNLATFLGRPPHIHRSYCDVSLPRDLDDESVALSGNALNTALDSVDAAGWSQVALPEKKLRPATVIRLRHHTAVLRERVLELCLGQKSDRVVEDARYVTSLSPARPACRN